MNPFVHAAHCMHHFSNRPMATQFTPDDDAVGVRIYFHHSGIGLVGNEIDMGVGPSLSDRG